MKKFYSLLVFLLFATPVFSQVLDNPRIERMNRGYNSSYNYFLSIDSDGYIMKTDVDINDFRKLEENLKATQNTITEQKREIDELKRTISNLEKKSTKMKGICMI